ncbi:hypothetical protein DV515_00014040 [Chloebia gouldiae]|uniref:Uncharacterized protein n=1 Tax=Chloebia gouldiae TaxID=44316 RepID=A0A3L8S0M2_CHLGU|nr:hypothetical protein DV515_00014040 [Chloebia gouldiae]
MLYELLVTERVYGGLLSDTVPNEVGTEWRSPWNRCIVNECVRVNNEVFVQQKNVSCSQMDVPECPEGTELRCDQVIDCCPSCRCVPLNGCPLNGTVIGHGRRLMVDQCTTCDCFQSAPRKYTLRCTKLNCQACPAHQYLEKKET